MRDPKLDRDALAFVEGELADCLTRLNRGIEKESLRVTEDGYLSTKPHPKSWGSALTNEYITTDYSEALPELITPVSNDRLQPRQWLHDIHQFIYQHMDDEILWIGSMPCILTKEEDVPLANYGTSNVGMMKHIYRRGLGYRYGRYMQVIAGVHYNFSLPEDFWPKYQEFKQDSSSLKDFISNQYLGLIRNYLRYCWLLPYLYGASPAICRSFTKGKGGSLLEDHGDGSLYGQYATSLRMSDLGYQNNAQSKFSIRHNDLDEYVGELERAIRTKDEFYEELGVKVDGEYRQLNANLLQIENEYYAKIRPKRVINPGERPTQALKRGGVQYVEVRSLDLNPFDPVGISQSQIDFLDVFLLFCLLQESCNQSDRENAENDENFRRTVYYGRKPDLGLLKFNRAVPLHEAALAIFEEMRPVAVLLDKSNQTRAYTQALGEAIDMAKDPDKTLSGQFLNNMLAYGKGYFGYTMDLSKKTRQQFLSEHISPEVEALFEREAAQSIEKQKQIEENDSLSFEEYLKQYFA
ncbi:glutamate--cysteine ligase [Kangiella sp.]|uniref:glutamate--cysteine ligase n=1 Tax=Kangiella sp. TaxID=1920245 RepID=UPI0019B72A92|nr:glutamate--cysteine ligase [Kangiella sp.]MBD3652627.1 glutamate--cysteine ligase [Kangiella sp.]